jgi:hypothetical protein
MIQITPQMRILLAVEPADFRCGIDGLARLCRERLAVEPMSGAPLDSNLVERMLKKAILHRKNSRFYKTENGAKVGDLYMALIATAKVAGADPFDFLTELLRHFREIAAAPADWLPWNYRETLRHLADTS